jgi:hypothetical protein
MNKMRRAALAAMERDLEKRAEQALVTVTLSTVTLITCLSLLVILR